MRWLKTSSALSVAAAGMLQAAGCFDSAGDCERNPRLACGPFSTTTGSGVEVPSEGTRTSGTLAECAGDPTKDATLVRKECGVFVQADAANVTETGTQTQPYKTLQKALDNAGMKRVYVCSSAPYEEAVTIDAPVEVYGGFECAKGWAWKATGRSTLTAPSGSIPLTFLTRSGGAKVQGFALTAKDATALGGSSIAVAVGDVAAALVSCEVTAGDGMVGEDGAPAGIATKGADALQSTFNPMNACLFNTAFLVGGPPGVTMCEDGMTAGGTGGKGGIPGMSVEGAPGADGTPADAIKGKGGVGQIASQECLPGLRGRDGADGSAGAPELSPGELSLMGISDTNTTDGKPGTRGSGGGGGGGARSSFCPDAISGNGPSGGGGGAGGCGGKGGGGGKAGGSSLAIVSLGIALTLTEVTLRTGKGGEGGKGALGQYRGAGGAGASGGESSGILASKPGCWGGDGGSGGFGGPGAGGRGGHSVGLAYVTAPTTAPEVKGFVGETAGPGGVAGAGNLMGNGAAGSASLCWDFSKNASCGQ